MELSSILITLLSTFATSPQNLCDDVYLNSDGTVLTDALGQTFSRYCQWTGPDVPVWADDVCCSIGDDGASCTTASEKTACATGERMYCKYGEKLTGGGVVCYQPFESMCDWGYCVAPPAEPPITQANLACCSPGVCMEMALDQILDCVETGGVAMFCHNGVSNVDGSITCFD